MARSLYKPDRRELMTAFGAIAVSPMLPFRAEAEPAPQLVLRAQAGGLGLQPPGVDGLSWSATNASRLRRGDSTHFTFSNDLPVPAELNWHGLDGFPQPRTGVAAGKSQTFQIPFRHAGTLLCDLRLSGDGQARSSRAMPVVVEESEPLASAADRDVMLLVEDWRLTADGTAVAPGGDTLDITPTYTFNALSLLNIYGKMNERLRFRFINGCQRTVIAIKIENHEPHVMALDSQPAEPFPARNGAVMLAPGGRADMFVDMGAAGTTSSILLHDGQQQRSVGRLTVSNEPPFRSMPLPAPHPLPSNGLPIRLDLKNALRFELALGIPGGGWVPPARLDAKAAAAFRVKMGRAVVLALTNRGELANVFHLHGHHFRLLDRLDDGWKPFWLDTLAIEPGQTQRIAFAAEYPGRWMIESFATDWAAPRLVRWFEVG